MRTEWTGRVVRCGIASVLSLFLASAPGTAAVADALPAAKISAAGLLWSPGRLAVDGAMTLSVVDSYRDRIQQFDRSGRQLVTIAVTRPSAIAAAPDGTLYIGSLQDRSVSRYRHGKRAGSLGDGRNEFASIGDIAVDPGTGDIYVVDTVKHLVKVYYPSGIPKGMLSGLHLPVGIAVTPDAVYVLDAPVVAAAGSTGATTGSRISVYSKGGNLLRSIDDRGAAGGQMARPMGIAVDRAGTVYVADALRKAVLVYSRSGAFIGRMESAANDINTAVAIVLTPDNRLYVSSSETHGIVEIGLGGTVYAGPADALAFISGTGERLTHAALAGGTER